MTGNAERQQMLNLIKNQMDLTIRFINFADQNLESNHSLTKQPQSEDY